MSKHGCTNILKAYSGLCCRVSESRNPGSDQDPLSCAFPSIRIQRLPSSCRETSHFSGRLFVDSFNFAALTLLLDASSKFAFVFFGGGCICVGVLDSPSTFSRSGTASYQGKNPRLVVSDSHRALSRCQEMVWPTQCRLPQRSEQRSLLPHHLRHHQPPQDIKDSNSFSEIRGHYRKWYRYA